MLPSFYLYISNFPFTPSVCQQLTEIYQFLLLMHLAYVYRFVKYLLGKHFFLVSKFCCPFFSSVTVILWIWINSSTVINLWFQRIRQCSQAITYLWMLLVFHFMKTEKPLFLVSTVCACFGLLRNPAVDVLNAFSI